MDVKRKKYFELSESTTEDTIFALLDAVDSEEESDIDNLMNDSDTEFIAEERISESECNDHSVLTADAIIHVGTDSISKPSESVTHKQKTTKKSKITYRAF